VRERSDLILALINRQQPIAITHRDHAAMTSQRLILPFETVEVVERRIKSYDCASVSEVRRESIRALWERNAPWERWLREEVVAGHNEYLADPSKGVPADGVLADVKARRRARIG
jgi:antitoxin ParD1/3/4